VQYLLSCLDWLACLPTLVPVTALVDQHMSLRSQQVSLRSAPQKISSACPYKRAEEIRWWRR
jgi:hypothetical protein